MPALIWIIPALLLIIKPLYACTTLIVGKNASENGKTIIARTSDTIDSRRAKNLKIYYEKDEKSYIGLPYWDLQFDEENDMSQVSTNSNGVSISATETIQSNPEVLRLDPRVPAQEGVTERNIPNLVMPDAVTARNAIDILGKAIEEKGVGGSKGFGVLFADKREAWYLETLSGHQWVAIQIPDDVYFVAANGPGQIQAYSPDLYKYKYSHFNGKTPMEFADQHNIAKTTAKSFDFRKTFADVANARNPKSNFVRVAYIQNYFNPGSQSFNLDIINNGSFPTFLKPEKRISIRDIQSMFVSHYEDFKEIDPFQSYTEKTGYKPIANLNTSNAHVTMINNSLEKIDPNIANLQYIALGMPTVSFFLPIYFGITEIPDALTGATNKADPANQKLFWQFRRLQTLVFLNDPNKKIPFTPIERTKIIKKEYAALAKEVEQDRHTMEAEYQKSHDFNLIDEFTKTTVKKVSLINRNLICTMMKELDIDSKYNLKTDQERALWFTAKVREQECNFKTKACK
ncbi:MAG: C69 family dipeptidase [Tatlockia sp.]|nr:C69 family dipeptidase [Tatlockia sp.]